MAQQTRNPTGDGTFTGTWSGSASTRYQAVDDHPDSGGTDKLTHGTTAGRGPFTYSAFTVPAGSTITNVQVLYYDQKTASQAASWGAYLRVGGTDRAVIDAHNPANGTWTLRTATATTNPATSAAWTVDDVNGSGSNPLQEFGLIATDASPTCEVASIQLVVNYTEPITGTGTLVAQNSTISGSGTAQWVATGVLVAGSSTADGTGEVGTGGITGTGALAAQAATIDGSGITQSLGIGALVAQASTVAGVGLVRWVASGTLVAGVATVVGVGEVTGEGSDPLAEQIYTHPITSAYYRQRMRVYGPSVPY